jgi:O-antigen/teichoic acid export membrane protein
VSEKLIAPDGAHQAGSAAYRRVAKNTFVLVALKILTPALAIALVFTLSRYLGVAGLGRYTLAFSFLSVFNAIAPLGLYAVITREGARDRAALEHLLGNAITLCAISSVFLTAAMMGLAYILDYDPATRTAIVILSLAILPGTIGMLQEGACVALERMDYIAIATIAEYALKVGAGISLLLMGYGLESVLFIAVLGRVIACIISERLLSSQGIPIRLTLQGGTIKELLSLAPTFLLIAIFATLYWRIDTFMLSQFRPMEDVGYYGAAWRILELVMVFPQSLCLSLYPQISSAAVKDLRQLNWIGRSAMRYLMTISLPAAIGVILLAEPILTLLYGQAFVEATSTFSILIFTLVPYSVVRYHAYVLVGANHQRMDLLLNAIMSGVNVVLNLILIPRYSYLGAAIATFVSICTYGVFQYVYFLRKLPGRAALPTVSPITLAACAAMAVVVWVLRDGNIFVSVGVGTLIYGVCLLVGGFFSEAELRLLLGDRLRWILRRP